MAVDIAFNAITAMVVYHAGHNEGQPLAPLVDQLQSKLERFRFKMDSLADGPAMHSHLRYLS